MPLTTIIASAQKRVKDSFASSPVVGLAMLSNGEESVKVIDAKGNVYAAGIAAPTVAPTVADNGVGLLPNNQWAAYLYVYASSKFPFVESDLAINGQLYPRSNASPYTAYQYTGAGSRKVTGLATKTVSPGIDIIWVFRTAFFATQIEAQTAAAAGAAFFVAQVANSGGAGTVAWTDNNPVNSADQVQSDNYVAPQFQFCVYYDPYWWGFGNLPFTAAASWADVAGLGVITLTGTDTWFDGRNGQNVTLPGITTGGFDGLGTFKFLWLTATTAGVTIDGTTRVALGATGSPGTVTTQGPATTLYRSKSRNPFSWGFTQTIGSVNVPQLYAFKVGGGMGTAIAVVPNNPTLKLDCEYPAKCFTLNLRAAGTTAFEGTRRIISDVYSVSAHFSQFAAITQNGQTVLWGLDYKNFAIVQSDGITQVPISGPIPLILRALTQDRTRQLLAHGVYDPRTELNCLWVCTASSLSLVNYLIYQHAPTGLWGFSNEQDVLSSGAIQDSLTGSTKIFVGTQTGFLGQAFVRDTYNNWLPDTGAFVGTCTAATSNTLTITESLNITDDGLVGNWALVTDATGQQEQMARISAVTLHSLTFDWIRPLVGTVTTAFSPVPIAGAKIYIGLIECRLLKYFDFNVPQTDKKLMELWFTQQSVSQNTANLTGTLVRWYRERENTYQQFTPLQNKYGPNDDQPSDAWFTVEDIPAELVKMFGLEIINRGYEQWRFVNMVLKPKMNP